MESILNATVGNLNRHLPVQHVGVWPNVCKGNSYAGGHFAFKLAWHPADNSDNPRKFESWMSWTFHPRPLSTQSPRCSKAR